MISATLVTSNSDKFSGFLFQVIFGSLLASGFINFVFNFVDAAQNRKVINTFYVLLSDMFKIFLNIWYKRLSIIVNPQLVPAFFLIWLFFKYSLFHHQFFWSSGIIAFYICSLSFFLKAKRLVDEIVNDLPNMVPWVWFYGAKRKIFFRFSLNYQIQY